jgi:hypothetical protein
MRKAATPRIRDGRIAYSTVSWFIQVRIMFANVFSTSDLTLLNSYQTLS